jgi:hypothetical protein
MSRRKSREYDGTESECEMLVKLQESPSETLEVLRTVCGESTMKKSNAFRCHKSFREDREIVSGDESQGALVTKRTEEKISKITDILPSDLRLPFRMIVDELDMSKGTLRKISVQDLHMRRLTAKLVQRNLTKEQKDRRLNLYMDITERNFKKIIFRIVSSLTMKHVVINTIARPNASPWSGDRRIPPGQKSHGCRTTISK